MTYETLTALGRDYNRQHAPGSETSEWQDFVAEVALRTGEMPWSDSLATKIVPQDVANYWAEVFSLTA
jgi:hypothetical protein